MSIRGDKVRHAREITKRLLFRISNYVKYLEMCSQQVESITEPVSILMQHVKNEQDLFASGYLNRIVNKVPIPPAIQALIIEDLLIQEETDQLKKNGRRNKLEIKVLYARRSIVASILGEWIQQQIELPIMKRLPLYKNLRTVIGSNWQLFFVEPQVLMLKRKNK